MLPSRRSEQISRTTAVVLRDAPACPTDWWPELRLARRQTHVWSRSLFFRGRQTRTRPLPDRDFRRE